MREKTDIIRWLAENNAWLYGGTGAFVIVPFRFNGLISTFPAANPNIIYLPVNFTWRSLENSGGGLAQARLQFTGIYTGTVTVQGKAKWLWNDAATIWAGQALVKKEDLPELGMVTVTSVSGSAFFTGYRITRS